MLALVDARVGRKPTGIGNYTFGLLDAIGAAGVEDVRPLVKPWHARRFRAAGLRPVVARPRRDDPARLPPAQVIHGPNFHALPHPSARRVATVHDLGFLHLPEHHPPGMSERLDAIVREALPLTERWICVSGWTRDDFVRTYGVPEDRCDVIHLGVSERFRPGGDEPGAARWLARKGIREPYLLNVGAMIPRKDLGTLLEAFRLVAGDHPELQLVIAGNKTKRWATDWPKVEAWLGEHPELARRVVILDYTKDAVVPALYRGAAAMVSTSLLEGFGLTILEALASGTPAVASRDSAIPEFAGETVLYGTPRRPETYAEGIERALRPDPERRAAGLEVARRMTWARTAEATVATYRAAAS
jgi:alpha-1,3-rhamnosyl/mannosyltransferase